MSRKLAPYAASAECSIGRMQAESGGEIRGPRNLFQRDRDRIIHSMSFRRLRHKTQVFVAPDGDHYRVRLTHSLEVAQIGRTIARALNLDEDLTEGLCLAHDIGHPPFGHAGEKALESAMAAHGGFDHNAQTLRTLCVLDCPYPDRNGLNLSWDMLEGLAKHNGPVTAPNWALQELDAAFPLHLDTHASLEAQVAAVADDIAYDAHDIDDGIRAGLLNVEQLCQIPEIAAHWSAIKMRFPAVAERRLVGELTRTQIGVMANDVIAATLARIADSGVESVTDVRAAGRMLAGFSEDMAATERRLKAFMYANLYHHPSQLAAADAAQTVVSGLFAAYANTPENLPAGWLETLPDAQPYRSRHIADFLAGMTDRFAVSEYARLFGRAAVPDVLLHV